MTLIYTDGKAQGGAWASQAGASEPDSFTSKLARHSENTSLIRTAGNPASFTRNEPLVTRYPLTHDKRP